MVHKGFATSQPAFQKDLVVVDDGYDKMSGGPNRPVKAIDTVFEILSVLQENNGSSLAELSEELEFAKSTIHSHLLTLENNEYVVKKDGGYYIGLKFLEHGMLAKNEYKIGKIGRESIENLADETGEVAWIIIEEHGKAVYLEKAMGEKAVQTHARVGGRTHLHHLASGKMILAHFPETRVDEIVDRHGLPKRTPNTITDRRELKEKLATLREKKFAFNDKETVLGLRAISAPVLVKGEVKGAISVSGPANRLTRERCINKIKPSLFESTNEIELKLQYPSQ